MKHFASITARYMDASYQEWSCVGVLHAIYTELGISVPECFGELTLHNFLDAFFVDPYHVQIAMLRGIRSLGVRSSACCPLLGDLLVMVINPRFPNVIKPGFFPAIYAGKNQVIASFLKSGVSTVRICKDIRPIAARRLI